MKFIYYTIIALVVVSVYGLSSMNYSRRPQTRTCTMSYSEKVLQIDQSVGDLFSLQSITAYPPFVALRKDADANMYDCEEFLMRNHTDQQKDIAICSMNGLSFPKYIKFLRDVIALYHDGRISQDVMFIAIGPGISISTRVVDNYSNQDLRALLLPLVTDNELRPLYREAIFDIMNGNAFRDLEMCRGSHAH